MPATLPSPASDIFASFAAAIPDRQRGFPSWDARKHAARLFPILVAVVLDDLL
jgi:hypothetical protein